MQQWNRILFNPSNCTRPVGIIQNVIWSISASSTTRWILRLTVLSRATARFSSIIHLRLPSLRLASRFWIWITALAAVFSSNFNFFYARSRSSRAVFSKTFSDVKRALVSVYIATIHIHIRVSSRTTVCTPHLLRYYPQFPQTQYFIRRIVSSRKRATSNFRAVVWPNTIQIKSIRHVRANQTGVMCFTKKQNSGQTETDLPLF